MNLRLILAVVGGVLVGFFLSMLTRAETPGDRIVATAQSMQAPHVVVIKDRKVTVLETATGKPIKDCESETSDCKTVVKLVAGDPVLVVKATGVPVNPRDIWESVKIHTWRFEGNSDCYGYWPPHWEDCPPH